MSDVTALLKARFPADVLGTDPGGRPPTAEVRRDRIREILRFLRDDADAGFDCLMDLTAVDLSNLDAPERFAVVYHLYSFQHNRLARVKAYVPEADAEIDSAVELWPAADWAERECYDMFGLRFRGHPNLRRILLPDAYEGWPLRKDYPLRGRGERGRFPKYVT